MGDQLPERGDQGHVRQRNAGASRGQLRSRPGHAGHRADPGPQRRHRRRPDGAQPFYGTDFTKPLLFLEDGAYYANQATAEHLTGDQWGVMNETGSYPGQPWLWLYQMWYHVPGWRNSANIDLIAIYMTGVATILLLCIPFIPGLRDIPRWIPVHRLIWRDWNRQATTGPSRAAQPPGSPNPPGRQK